MDKLKKKNEKIEIGIAEKVEEVEEEAETLEIKGESLLIKIPNNLATVTRVRRILEVYEEELGTNETDPQINPTLPELPTLPEMIEEQKKVEVKPYEHYIICPLCAGKLKKKKLRKEGTMLKQRVFCKNKRCQFERIYEFSI